MNSNKPLKRRKFEVSRCQYCDEELSQYNPYLTCELCMEADRVDKLMERLADIIRALKDK